MRSDRFDSPFAPMIVSLVAIVFFVLLRLAHLGGDPSRFVVAGEALSDPTRVPRSLYVIRNSSGYDGQAFYRLALDPFTRARTDFGITLDTPPYRQQRIGYPLAAWVLSGGGSPRALAWSLIWINVAAFAWIGFAGGALARAAGRHAMWGLVFTAHSGFVVSVARDLSEPLAAALMLTGLFLLRRSRATAAALALTGAVLTRETTAVVPIGLAAAWLIDTVVPRRRPRRRPMREFLFPLGVLGAWQLLLTSWWGQIPFTSNKNASTAPFLGLVRHLRYVFDFPSTDSVSQLLEIGVIVLVLTAAVVVIRSDKVLSHERWALLAAGVNASLLSASVWIDHAHFLRALTEVYLLAALVLIVVRPRVTKPLFVLALLLASSVAGTFVRNL